MTPTQLKHQARVYIAQAKATKHRNFAFVLLTWAANCRREAQVGQREMFA